MRYAQLIVICAVLCAPASGYAQGSHVAGVFGLTFAPQFDFLLSGEFSGNVHRDVGIYGNFSYLNDVLQPHSDLSDAAEDSARGSESRSTEALDPIQRLAILAVLAAVPVWRIEGS